MPIDSRANGQTIDETWFNILKDAIEALEASDVLQTTGMQIHFEVQGNYSKSSTKEDVMFYQVMQDLTVLSARLYVYTPGSAGSTQVDIKRKRGAGAYTSLFTTKPSIPYTAGASKSSDNGTGATAAVIDSTVDELLAGDILRFDFTAVQTNGIHCWLSLVVEPTGV